MTASFNQPIIDEFRANEGRVGGPFAGGDLLLLTTTGARSGAEHTVPLGYVREGDLLLVVASAGGAPRHPAWYHNVLAHPMVALEVGTETFGAVAVPAAGERRDRLFAHVVRAAPGYADYQTRTTRVLPVVTLERSEPTEPHEVTSLADKLVEIHTWLRAQLRHVRADTDAYFAARDTGDDASPVPGLGLQLRAHCLAFCESMRFHHTGEDEYAFPGLASQYPHLATTIDRLGEQHRALARLQDRLLALLAGIGTADPDRFRAKLDRLTTELTAHLDDEERCLLPVLAEVPFPPTSDS